MNMKNDNSFISLALTAAGAVMILSGLLLALCQNPAVGGIFWAAASCLFLAAHSLRTEPSKQPQK